MKPYTETDEEEGEEVEPQSSGGGEPPESEAAVGQGGEKGRSYMIDKNPDGTYCTYEVPYKPATEEEYPDGFFGLKSMGDAMKGVIQMETNGPGFDSQEDDAMMGEFNKQDMKENSL